jgi:hypothetical protein
MWRSTVGLTAKLEAAQAKNTPERYDEDERVDLEDFNRDISWKIFPIHIYNNWTLEIHSGVALLRRTKHLV